MADALRMAEASRVLVGAKIVVTTGNLCLQENGWITAVLVYLAFLQQFLSQQVQHR